MSDPLVDLVINTNKNKVNIHPLAIVDSSAVIGKNVSIGPWSYIGPKVEIGEGTIVHSHVVIKGPTKIGKYNEFFQFASIGEACQDKKYKGEPTTLDIGDYNIIRESCTIHRGTIQGNGVTKIGDHNLLMAYVHVAHDCSIGNECILANNASLAGHVTLADKVVVGGMSGLHQFIYVGSFSMIAGMSRVVQDVPAFLLCGGMPAVPHGLNIVGLKRMNYSPALIKILKQCYNTIYRKGLSISQAVEEINQFEDKPIQVLQFLDSIEKSTRGIIR